jgi:hypothetical protein
MANAPLTLRFGSDVEGAKRGVASLATSIASNMATVAGSALTAGKTVAAAGQGILSTFQGIQRAAGLISPAVFALVTGFLSLKLAESAIAAVKDQLATLLDVANKSRDRGVSAEFFQAFIAGAKGAEDRVKALEDALASAFQATKAMLNPEWTNWNAGIENTLVKVSAVEKAMREARELFTTDQNFSGFDLFRNAKDQDSKIKAVLLYMQQLKAIGADVAALDIGEKMFGEKFADKIRTGEESIDRIVETLDKGGKNNFISNEAAKNAKELDDRLNDAWHTISERMKPDWDDLANIALRIKGVWTQIIEAVANYKAAELKARPFAGVNSTKDEDARNSDDPNTPAFGNPVLLNQGRRRRGQAPVFGPTEEIDESRGLNMTRRPMPEEEKAEPIPMPRRRPQDAPKPKKEEDEKLDQIETLINLMTRANDTLKVQLDTEGKSNVEREKGIALAKAEAAARQAQRDLTEEEKSKVLALAEAHATLAAKLKDVQQALAANAENARLFGNAASGALGSIWIDGQKANDVLGNLLKQQAKFALQAGFTGQGPLASLLGLSTAASAGPNAVGGITGLIGKLLGFNFGGATGSAASNAASGFTSNDFAIFRAGGGDVKAGRTYTVGETGMEKFVPGADGKIFPVGNAGAGGGTTTNHILVDVTGATGNAEIARMVNVGMQAAYARAIAAAPGAVIEHQRRRA